MTSDRWNIFSKREQLLFIGSEFERARVWHEKGDIVQSRGALERALALIDFSIGDPKWKESILQLLALRAETAAFYAGIHKGNVSVLYSVL